jgi:hypothetical protein
MDTQSVILREMTLADYDAVMALWSSAEGVRANESREEFDRILRRNPNLSCVAVVGDEFAGAVLPMMAGAGTSIAAVANAFVRAIAHNLLIDVCPLQTRHSRCIFLLDNAAANCSGDRPAGMSEPS